MSRDFTRNKVRERDNHTCQNCGRQRKEGEKQLDVHHLNGLCGEKSRGYDRLSDMPGLITLCHKCHFNRHDWAGRNKIRVDTSIRDEIIFNLYQELGTLRKVALRIGFCPETIRQAIKRKLPTIEI